MFTVSQSLIYTTSKVIWCSNNNVTYLTKRDTDFNFKNSSLQKRNMSKKYCTRVGRYRECRVW